MKKYVPWPVKMAIKLACSVFGLTKAFQKMHIFEQGHHDPEKSIEIFNQHFKKAKKYLDKDFTVLELGPGYSLNTAVIARHYGARFTYLIDKGDFGKKDLTPILNLLNREDHDVQYKYMTEGLESLRQIPDKTVDFVFSHVVLEHIIKNELLDTLKELRRITKDNGVHSHTIDLRDHLNSSLNHLKFSEETWESNIFRNSGFYTNRIRYNEMLELFEKAGFEYKILMKDKFKGIKDKNLCIAGFHVLLFPCKH